MASNEITIAELSQMIRDEVGKAPTLEAKKAVFIFLTNGCFHYMTNWGVCGLCGLSPTGRTEVTSGEDTTTIAK